MEFDIMQAISSVGFPIAACIAMFILLDRQRKEHKEEMDKVVEALNNNTSLLQIIKESLSKLGVG